MAIVTPTVEPAIGSAGNSISTEPKILFDKAIDLGSVNSSNFFIVSIKKLGTQSVDDFMQTSNSIEDIVESTLDYRRVNLADLNDFIGDDDGTSANAGQLYRSEVTIKPKVPLNPNTDYAVIISNKVSVLSVFDAQITTQTGTGNLLTAGVFEGLSADTYVIQVTQAGDSNNAYYTWMRTSDAMMSDPIQARGRHIEIDRGVKVKFEAGSYEVGDTFEINVIPEDNISEIYNWTFATGLGDYELPEDQNSGDILDLSVNNGNGNGNGDVHHFYVESIVPELGESLVKIANKGIAIIENVVIQTKEDTSSYNGTKVELVAGGTAGSETVSFSASLIQVTIEEGVSTSQDIIDALNNDAGFAADLTAYLGIESIAASAKSVRIKKGVDPNTIVITFNKDVDPQSLGGIKVTRANVYPFGAEEELFYTSSVSGRVVTLTIEE